MKNNIILILGGSFDPVHIGHVEIAKFFCNIFKPCELRLIPAGCPWQKKKLFTETNDRLEMLNLAFSNWSFPLNIDLQEVNRIGPSYMVDTLKEIRSKKGNDTVLILLLGADQLTNLHTWHNWKKLFSLTNICFITRPNFSIEKSDFGDELAEEIRNRTATLKKISESSNGYIYIEKKLKIPISSTMIRVAVKNGLSPIKFLPQKVENYIKKNNIYR
tara:strand:- start:377 stop:1027 length:651 start_codon:yes stop_codon:yes gene_type:complete